MTHDTFWQTQSELRVVRVHCLQYWNSLHLVISFLRQEIRCIQSCITSRVTWFCQNCNRGTFWQGSVIFDRFLSTCQGGVTFWHPPDTLTDICEIGVWFLMELDSIFYGEFNGAIGFEIRYVESNFRSVFRRRISRRICYRTPWGGVIGSGFSNTVCSAYFYDSNAI